MDKNIVQGNVDTKKHIRRMIFFFLFCPKSLSVIATNLIGQKSLRKQNTLWGFPNIFETSAFWASPKSIQTNCNLFVNLRFIWDVTLIAGS